MIPRLRGGGPFPKTGIHPASSAGQAFPDHALVSMAGRIAILLLQQGLDLGREQHDGAAVDVDTRGAPVLVASDYFGPVALQFAITRQVPSGPFSKPYDLVTSG